MVNCIVYTLERDCNCDAHPRFKQNVVGMAMAVTIKPLFLMWYSTEKQLVASKNQLVRAILYKHKHSSTVVGLRGYASLANHALAPK